MGKKQSISSSTSSRRSTPRSLRKPTLISTKDASILAALALFAQKDRSYAVNAHLTKELEGTASKRIARSMAKSGSRGSASMGAAETARDMRTWASHQVRLGL